MLTLNSKRKNRPETATNEQMEATKMVATKMENMNQLNNENLPEAYLMIMSQERIDEIEEKIHYHFQSPELLVQAFTRKSFSEECVNYCDNEKLEFVGDKALDLIVVKKLTKLFGFKRSFQNASIHCYSDRLLTDVDHIELARFRLFDFSLSEGEMTERKKQVVQTRFLANAIEKMGLERYLIMGKGDIKLNVQEQPHVKEDLLEAIIGAVAVDSDWDMKAIEQVIDSMLDLDYHLQYGVDDGTDYVSYVQNWHQREYGEDPEYKFVDCENGFACHLYLKILGEDFLGYGHSKKAAIRMAAKKAYPKIEELRNQNKTFQAVLGDDVDISNAVSKLQMLSDKKMITGLRYDFEEMPPVKESAGNPTWSCTCHIDELDARGFYINYSSTSKKEAQKYAALTAVRILLTGRDIFMEMMTKERQRKPEIQADPDDAEEEDDEVLLSAVSVLKMLSDKKLITGLAYEFEELPPTEESKGNPMWSCTCHIDELKEYGVDIRRTAVSKQVAKEMASASALELLDEKLDCIKTVKLQKKKGARVGDIVQKKKEERESGVNLLRALSVVKVITGLAYEFEELAPTEESQDNPTWKCTCYIDELKEHGGNISATAASKKEAQKKAAEAAFDALFKERDFNEKLDAWMLKNKKEEQGAQSNQE